MAQTIVLGTDHAGFELKEHIKRFLQEQGFQVEDIGAAGYDEKDDYPDFIIPAAKKVAELGTRGIIFGGSGQGEAIAANKVPGVRAALWYGGPEDILTLSRTHNNANILSLGARFVDRDQATKAVKLWLDTPPKEEERHARRIKKIEEYERTRK